MYIQTQTNELDVLNENKVVLEEETKKFKKELKKYQDELSHEREHIEKLQNQNSNLEQRLDEQRKLNEKMCCDLENHQKHLFSLKETFQVYLNENKQMKCDLAGSVKRIKVLVIIFTKKNKNYI